MSTISDDDRCELDPNKICDNCFRCLEPDEGQDYARIEIAAVYTDEDYIIDGMDTDSAERVPMTAAIHTHTIYGVKAKRRI